MAGINTQNTILGIYNYNGKEKIVCACEDFTDEEHILYEFESIALGINPDKKIGLELSDIINILSEIEKKKILNISINDNIRDRLWDMFIIDGLIGNTDRHNENWGFLVNKKGSVAEFASIYDCGSCLNPLIDDIEISNISYVDKKNLAINCYSCIKDNGKKINYMTYISSVKNKECNNALLRVFKNIKIDDINEFIDNTLGISNIRKEFYKHILNERYEILKSAYLKISK